jgi:deoxyribodipyrimidine photo-lyase
MHHLPSSTLWWIRRDLRLTDNQALAAAVQAGQGTVTPVFVLDETLCNGRYSSPRRNSFLFGGLQALDAALRERGARLIVRQGDPAQVLAQLVLESGATAVFAERDHSPYAVARDERVRRALAVPFTLTDGIATRAVGSVVKDDGTPYTVFTPFQRRWLTHGPFSRGMILPAPKHLTTPEQLASLPIPQPAHALERFPPGEVEAKARLSAFINGAEPPVVAYAANRDQPALPATSALSPYLRFGMLSARMAALGALHVLERKGGEGPSTWLSELIWRDFYINILAHFPHVRAGAFRPEYNAIAWRNDPDEFAAWCAGRTGFPIVDAAMRQLNATGWMHNRVRMIVASFLVKDLLIDWRWGERYFMQQLLDGDPAANNGGWQWSAGTGTDAAPYFRIFSPLNQGQKFDANGDFIRRWVPELAELPAKYIHEPAGLPPEKQARLSFTPGIAYPLPIVDHKVARARVLAAYKVVKGMPE